MTFRISFLVYKLRRAKQWHPITARITHFGLIIRSFECTANVKLAEGGNEINKEYVSSMEAVMDIYTWCSDAILRAFCYCRARKLENVDENAW